MLPFTTKKFLENNCTIFKISRYSLRQQQKIKPSQIAENMNKFVSMGSNKRKSLSSINEIPLTFNTSKLFTFCGFASGLTLILIPKTYLRPEIDLSVFPNININSSNDYKLFTLFLLCSMCCGYIGGNMYRYKTFKWGDYKRLYKVLGNLVNKTPLALIHSSGFTTICYYGVFLTFTGFETLVYGKPYGFEFNDKNKSKYQYGNKRLLGKDKSFLECTYDERMYRLRFACELNANWFTSTAFIVFPIFFCGGSFLIATHRKYWLSVYSRLKKP